MGLLSRGSEPKKFPQPGSLAFGFVFLGAVAILTSFLWDKVRPPDLIRLQLGSVVPIVGESKKIDPLRAETVLLKERTPFFENDLVVTDDASQARIFFENGGQVLLTPDSQIRATQQLANGKLSPWVEVVKGDAIIENRGIPALSLKKLTPDNSLWAPTKIGSLISPFKQKENESSTETATSSASKAQDKNGQRLSSSEITLRLGQNRKNFLKCYGGLLQKSPHAKGEVALNFTISATGRIQNPSIEGTIPDPSFQSCLLETLDQIRFRAFRGDAIMARFPLIFE